MSDLVGAFILHRRPYRETSLLLECFTVSHGRVAMVARGARGRKRATRLEPFHEMWMSWGGKSDLKYVKHAETVTPSATLVGNNLFLGLYVNELLTRVLEPEYAMPELYQGYCDLLAQLRNNDADVEIGLRRFEFGLLEQLGYGMVFDREVNSGDALQPESQYAFEPGTGYVECSAGGHNTFSGQILLELANERYDLPAVRKAAKFLTRSALSPLLGDRPLRSRELFLNKR